MATELWAFSDESGIEPDQHYCLMAGYVANPPTWDAFERDWEIVRTRERLKELSTKRYFLRKNRRQHYIADFIEVIENHDIRPRGFAVEWSVFQTLSMDEQVFLAGGHSLYLKEGNPYYTLLYRLVAQIAAELGSLDPTDVQIHFMFDEQHKHKAHVLATYDMLKQETIRGGIAEARLMGMIAFDESYRWPGLQAADLLCHTWLRVLRGETGLPREMFKRACKGAQLSVLEKRDLVTLLG